MTPATIDSHGKPGIAGITSAVVVVDVDAVTSELLVTDEDVTTLVETDAVVTSLVTAPVDEVLDVLASLEVTLLVTLAEELEEVLEEELLIVLDDGDVVVVTLAGTPPGGSRWKIKANVAAFGTIFVPTAKPFVLERNAKPLRVDPAPAAETGLSNVDHELLTGSKCTVTGRPALSVPTAHPSVAGGPPRTYTPYRSRGPTNGGLILIATGVQETLL